MPALPRKVARIMITVTEAIIRGGSNAFLGVETLDPPVDFKFTLPMYRIRTSASE